MTDLERAAMFGAEAMAKVDAGEPTTELEDKIVLGAVGRQLARAVEAGRAAEQERQLVAA